MMGVVAELIRIFSIFGSLTFWMEVVAYAIIVLSLNLEYGWTGIPNFGKVAFVSMGGLAAAIALNYIIVPMLASITPAALRSGGYSAAEIQTIMHHVDALREALKHGLAPGTYDYTLVMTQHVVPLLQLLPQYYFLLLVFALALSVLLGGLFALIIAYPVVRLREDYLAIVLLMASFLMWMIYTYFPPLIGGTFGILVQTGAFTTVFKGYADLARLSILGLGAIISLLFAEVLLNTPFGRMLRAVRDDEVAAEALGKNVTRTRLVVIMISSIWAAMGGVLYILVYVGSIHPDFFKLDMTFLWIAMMLLGGIGNNIGAVVGTIVLTFLYHASQILIGDMLSATGLSSMIVQQVRGLAGNLLIGLLIILILFLRPQGLLPETPVKTPIWLVFEKRMGYLPKRVKSVYMRILKPLYEVLGRRGKRSSPAR